MGTEVPFDTLDEAIESIMNQCTLNPDLKDASMESFIENAVFQLPQFSDCSLVEKGKIAKVIFNRMCAYDILQPYLDDPEVSEIMCNGYDAIFIEKFGVIEKTNAKFHKVAQYKALLHRIAAEVNRKIDFSSPIVDARLRDGSRVSIVLDPVALNGPILTIRKFSEKVYTLDDLTAMDSISPEGLTFLKRAVKERLNIFISGGTGSGKTTMLNALCQEISNDERIITIEDSAEINICGVDNVVSLEKRDANLEGLGEISIATLIKTALRMRPDRIIVGEIRGAEAIDMLQAMNTGHAGSISTGHSNSSVDMLRRIETMVLYGLEIPVQAIRQQIVSAIDVIVHVERRKDGKRGVVSIECLKGLEGDAYLLESVMI